jgi:hypothetical protein
VWADQKQELIEQGALDEFGKRLPETLGPESLPGVRLAGKMPLQSLEL